jgi:hypothetical protein
MKNNFERLRIEYERKSNLNSSHNFMVSGVDLSDRCLESGVIDGKNASRAKPPP